MYEEVFPLMSEAWSSLVVCKGSLKAPDGLCISRIETPRPIFGWTDHLCRNSFDANGANARHHTGLRHRATYGQLRNKRSSLRSWRNACSNNMKLQHWYHQLWCAVTWKLCVSLQDVQKGSSKGFSIYKHQHAENIEPSLGLKQCFVLQS